MQRPSTDIVKHLADCAELPLRPESVAGHAEHLGELLAAMEEWDGLGFSFDFDEGTFSYVQMPVQYRPRKGSE